MSKKLMVLLFTFVLLPSAPALADPLGDFDATLNIIHEKFKNRYSNESWKRQLFGWSMDTQFNFVSAQAHQKPYTIEEGDRLIQDYIASTRDYHVRFFKGTSGSASIDFSVRTVNSKTFVVFVGPQSAAAGLQQGDEILSIDGISAQSALDEIARTRPYVNRPATDLGRLDYTLTNRFFYVGDPRPKSLMMNLLVRNLPCNCDRAVNLSWTVRRNSLMGSDVNQHPRVPQILQGNMFMRSPSERAAGSTPFEIGSTQSYLPPPQDVLWMSQPADYFQSWVARLPNGKKLGFIRVPNFSPGSTQIAYSNAITSFGALVQRMNLDADILLLDMNQNSGGNIDYGYALVSFFLDHDISTPKFEYSLNSELTGPAAQALAQLEQIKNLAEAQAYFGVEYFGFPVDMDFVADVKNFYATMVADWQAGLRIGRPVHYNSARIKPRAAARFLKPLYVMIDEMSFSCADTIPSIFQDVGRAQLIGRTSAGAGAFVGSAVPITTPMGYTLLRVPMALGLRLNGQRVENLGVTPDFGVDLTHDDLRFNFKDYGDKIYQRIMVQNP